MNKLDSIIRGLLLLVFGHSLTYAQESATNKIEDQFEQYHRNAVNEKLFVHTDKNFYLAGEILWFKLYYVDGDLHKPLDLSKLAYLEILDKDHKPVLQSKIALREGSGNGSLFLPVSLNSGVYRLRAYTQWMKNFSPDHFFEMPLNIVNAVKSLDPQIPQQQMYEVGFFPEGGNLVQDIESKLAFKIIDRSGKGVNGNGIVLNQNNDTIARFKSLKFGIGHFLFTPRGGNNYKALISINDTLVVHNLPVARQQGYVMNVSKEGESKLRVTVSTNVPSSNTVSLLIHTRQKVKLSEEKLLNKGTATFVLDIAKLGEGISHLTVFDGSKQPVCERLYFVRPANKLVIEPGISQQQFTSRSKVAIQVISKDESGSRVPADLSISVYRAEATPSYETMDISNYLWLTSDLKGNIESPGYYFSAEGSEVQDAADNLMLTHGWRRFVWKDIINKTTSRPGFVPEFRGHIINAKVTNTRTGLPAPGVITYLSVPGERIQLYSAKSDADGKLSFYTRDFYGPNEILLQTDNRTDSIYRIEVISPFSEQNSSTALPPFQLPAAMKDPLVDQSVSVQVQNVFSGDSLKQFHNPDIDSVAFYGTPDNTYLLDNYVRFSTMEEVLREYVLEVLVRRQKENFRLIMSGGLETKAFMDNPITLFNGVPVFETNRIMQYDPLKVRKIEVVRSRYFYGPMMLNGIVNFTTYQPDPAMISGLNAVVFDYEGLQFTREFYSPVYITPEQVSSRLPDFRNQLFWAPDIRTDVNGKSELSFYTSDQKGEYIIVVQGMSADGKTGERFISFTVK